MLPASPSRSRWYILATIGLMLLVIPGGWLLVRWHEIRAQCNVVAEIRRAGGTVEYSAQGPEWLRRLLGDEWFQRAFDAYLGPLTTDKDAEHLKWLTELQILWLNGTNITDAGLEYLRALPQLQELYLGPKITDAGLEHLKGLSGLRYLDLTCTQATEKGVEELRAALPRCRILY